MTAVDNTNQPPSARRESLLARHPLTFYSIMAYAFSWFVCLPFVLSKDGAGLLSYRSPIGGDLTLYIFSFGPALAAFIMTSITEGMPGIRRLLKQIVLWRVGLRWYLFALVRPARNPGTRHDRRPGKSGVVQVDESLVLADRLFALLDLPCTACRRTTWGRAGLARLRAASLTAAIWSFDRNSHPRTGLGILARPHMVDCIASGWDAKYIQRRSVRPLH